MKRNLTAGLVILSLACLAGCAKESSKGAVNVAEKEVYEEGFNIYDLPELPIEEELLETMFENKTVRIERIVSTGQETDGWYDQEEDEYIVLVEGSAKLEYEDGSTVELKRGDSLLIPAHQVHRVAYTSEDPACIWLCVFWKSN